MPVFPAGRRLRASELNSIANPPICIASRVANQSIVTATYTAVLLDTEVKDTATMFAPTSKDIFLSVDGTWDITAGGVWGLAGAGERILGLFVAGLEVRAQSSSGSATNTVRQSVTETIVVTGVTTVDMRAYQNSGGPLTFTGQLSARLRA